MNTNQHVSEQASQERTAESQHDIKRRGMSFHLTGRRCLWLSLGLQFIWPVLYLSALSLVLGGEEYNPLVIASDIGHVFLLFPILILYYVVLLGFLYLPMFLASRSSRQNDDRYWCIKCTAGVYLLYMIYLVLFFPMTLFVMFVGQMGIVLLFAWLGVKNKADVEEV